MPPPGPDDATASSSPLRREPPEFRPARVARTADRSPRLRRVTLSGPALRGLDRGLPAASVRLLLPRLGEDEPELPTWTGNEFLAEDGTRPHIRTLTPLRVEPDAGELDVDIVRHGDGPLGRWIERVSVGDPVAVSGTGRGYTIDEDARHYLLAGDESALPAIGLLLPRLPPQAAATVLVEVADPAAEVALDHRDGSGAADVSWLVNAADRPGDHLVDAVVRWADAQVVDEATRVWVAGEAAAVNRIRRHLFEEVGMSRRHATVRGYWKLGRAASTDD